MYVLGIYYWALRRTYSKELFFFFNWAYKKLHVLSIAEEMIGNGWKTMDNNIDTSILASRSVRLTKTK